MKGLAQVHETGVLVPVKLQNWRSRSRGTEGNSDNWFLWSYTRGVLSSGENMGIWWVSIGRWTWIKKLLWRWNKMQWNSSLNSVFVHPCWLQLSGVSLVWLPSLVLHPPLVLSHIPLISLPLALPSLSSWLSSELTPLLWKASLPNWVSGSLHRLNVCVALCTGDLAVVQSAAHWELQPALFQSPAVMVMVLMVQFL